MASGEAARTEWASASATLRDWSRAALDWAARGWLAVTVAGQLAFALYIVVLYGGALLRADFAAWNTVMTHGHVPGAPGGNIATGVHLLGAALIMLSGALQLVPRVRTRMPALHRWNGRVYLAAAVGASATGIYMVWWRGAVGDMAQHAGITLNGVLIIVCAGMALWRIRTRDIAAHRRWALRLFLAVSGVWFFRIGLMFWLAVHQRPAGFDPGTFTGPFLTFLAFAQTLLPLAILEWYLRCRDHGAAAAQWAMACVLAAVTVAMATGIGVATMVMWLPRL